MRSLPSTSSAAQEAAVEVIATAIRLPLIFDFDPLFKLDAVVAAKNNELFSLLQIFLNDGLIEFKAWEDSHPAALEKHSTLLDWTVVDVLNLSSGLDRTEVERKIRLLTLASLGFTHVGQDLPYSKVAEALQVESSDVEKWAIDGKYRR